MKENIILFNYSAGFRQRYPKTCTAIADKIDNNNFESAIKAVMVANKSGLKFSLRLQEATPQEKKSIYFLVPELSALPDESLSALFANGGVQLGNAAELIAMMKDEKDASIESLIDAQLTELKALCTAKRNAIEKKTTLEQEMIKIYPHQQVQLIEEEQS